MNRQNYKTAGTEQLSLLKQKLSAVDSHIRKTQKLPATLFMHPQLLQYVLKQNTVDEKLDCETTNQILLNNPKSILFSSQMKISVYFINSNIQKNKRFCLKIQPSHVNISVELVLDGKSKGIYSVRRTQGIMIEDIIWKKAEFIFAPKQIQRLSLAKIQMTTITVQHNVKIHGVPSQKKIVDQKLKQFFEMNSNKDKIQQIMQKRRSKSFSRGSSIMLRAKTAEYFRRENKQQYNNTLFKNYTSKNNENKYNISTSTNFNLQNRIQSAQLKKDFITFQQSKSKFLQQFKKMKSERANQIKQHKYNYQLNKKQTLQSFSCLTIGFIFMLHTYKMRIKLSKSKMDRVHARLLCRRFIKNMIHSTRSRLILKVKNKLSLNINIGLVSTLFWQQDKSRAQKRIINSVKGVLFKVDIAKAMKVSQNFNQKVKFVQRQFRLISQRYYNRFIVLVTKIKKFDIQDPKILQQLFKKYKQFCYTKSNKLKFGFMKYHKKIDELIQKLKL